MKKLLSIGAAVTLSSILAVNAEASEYKVEPGDTLASIANENGVSVEVLTENNSLSSNLILPGQMLTIKKEIDDRKDESVTTEEAYIIQAGDTLFEIAEKFDITVNALKDWNHLSSDEIYEGEILIVSEDSAIEEVNGLPAANNKQAEKKQPEETRLPAENQSIQDLNFNGAQDWGSLAVCESGGDASVVSANGLYHGLYQFDVQTWQSVGGSGLPSEASAAEQTKRAQQLYSERGAQPWPVCGQNL